MVLMRDGVKCRGLRVMIGYRSERRPCGVVYRFFAGTAALFITLAFGSDGVRRGVAIEDKMDFESSLVSLE
jgi:hypothetical protein